MTTPLTRPELTANNPKLVKMLSDRLSLRAPQREAVEILDALFGKVLPPKADEGLDAEAWVARIKEALPGTQFREFEREFVSLAFALATGVGKTRLMGAMIAYLHLLHGVKHFFVLAPNLTIYNKLIQDFSSDSPKYVFRGIQEFVTDPPIIITGEDYTQRDWAANTLFGRVQISIFNISKINSEVRGGREPRIRKMQEALGTSYFEYLKNLPDLVLLMDESHRYRASAGVRAINELRPRLGLELTATPYVETSKGPVAFRNIVQDYPLGRAIADRYVKIPAVVTRKDFNPAGLSPDDLEHIKLSDGVRLHESVKVDLDHYARESGEKYVKPFMLVIARDTTHAKELYDLMVSTRFMEGRYAGKVIQVDHTSEDLMIERLLKVEDPDELTEIVIHVNMLKEGWDVTNLYTIVPLRAANARVLIEQSIGRGLRLPYGKRVDRRLKDERGQPLTDPIDRLNIVAHDRFQEIIEEANRDDSLLKLVDRVLLEEDGQLPTNVPVLAAPGVRGLLGLDAPRVNPASEPTTEGTETPASTPEVPATPAPPPVFTTPAEQTVARVAYQAMQDISRDVRAVPSVQALQHPEVQQRLIERVQAKLPTVIQPTLLEGATAPAPDVAKIVAQTANLLIDRTISIPRILVVPEGEAEREFLPFTLDLSKINYQPPDRTMVVQNLNDNKQEWINSFPGGQIEEQNLSDLVVKGLLRNPEISYDENADTLYHLADQVVAHFEAKGHNSETIRDILVVNERQLSAAIFTQMEGHQTRGEVRYLHEVRQGFTELRTSTLNYTRGGLLDNPQARPPQGLRIESCVYTGFQKSLYPQVKFQSDAERILALVLDRDAVKWFRPVKGQFLMTYRMGHQISEYQPDFVAETENEVLMLEVKAANEVDDDEVQEKAKVAREWCEAASEHVKRYGGKPWRYSIIPHNEIAQNHSLGHLAQLK
ncbi:DEAD/DEAH box helicase [Deinococcus antarcticus]|uniref:DEAD/DEAH box helicase n=1 Tax=Deinococcus antarcticus TaxID=1298767 RepID=A0ABV8A6V1_9DEIO